MSEAGGTPQSFELPNAPPAEVQQNKTEKTVEAKPTTQEGGVGKKAPQTTKVTAPTIPQISQLPITTDPVQTPTTSKHPKSPTDDLTADDVDLIEKQWIDRAKAIVAQTQEDPYRQKNEMSKVKADYIHKRFKKVIKTDDPFDATQGRPEPSRTGDALST